MSGRCLQFLWTAAAAMAMTTGVGAAGVFDMKAIVSDPLDAKVLSRTNEAGIVIEEVEFTSDRGPSGDVIRTYGVLAYPAGGTNLPAVMWGQGGMADANPFFPRTFAKKGYVSMAVTLPKKEWNAFGAFDVANPKNGNLVRLAVTHMRGITYLSQRPEVDSGRIGIAGASYGGVYASLVAGADPRVKAGMSFFSGGRHRFGTSLPQFTGLKSIEEVEAFEKVADAATYLGQRAVPFLWGVAANDNWFHLPALIETYKASIGEKRMAILPHWQHGFDEATDRELVDWFDTQLMKTRAPYNQPGEMKVSAEDGKLVGRWTWTGTNDVTRADLVVSYGPVRPWHGWVHRYHHPMPAALDGQSASAEILVPETDLPMLVYGNIVDVSNVTISTLPVEVVPAKLGIRKPSGKVVLNTCPFGALEAADTAHLEGEALPFGIPDVREKHGGQQSIRVDTPRKAKSGPKATLKLLHVPERSHRLSLWLKASAAVNVDVRVQAVAPQHWKSAAVQSLLKTFPGSLPVPPADAKPASYSIEAAATTDWQEFIVECPWDGVAVDGYNLIVSLPKDSDTQLWVDDVRFTPEWRR